jgi:hypothetical protein
VLRDAFFLHLLTLSLDGRIIDLASFSVTLDVVTLLKLEHDRSDF